MLLFSICDFASDIYIYMTWRMTETAKDIVLNVLLCGDQINVLLCGDPGTSNSQLLQYVTICI